MSSSMSWEMAKIIEVMNIAQIGQMAKIRGMKRGKQTFENAT